MHGHVILMMSESASDSSVTFCLLHPDLIISRHNQRTNGPVNAHLRSGVYTNKLV